MFLAYFNVFLIRFACHFRNVIVQRLRATCRISALYKCMNYYYYYFENTSLYKTFATTITEPASPNCPRSCKLFLGGLFLDGLIGSL